MEFSSLLAEAEDAFVASRGVTSPGPAAVFEYEGQLTYHIWRRLSPKEWELTDCCAYERKAALAAARAGQFEHAGVIFDQIAGRLSSQPLSVEANLVNRMFLEQARAYLDYRLQDYRAARGLVLSAAAKVQQLVRDFGYGIFSVNCLLLGQNLVRIDARSGQLESAVALARGLLDHIELRAEMADSKVVCPRPMLDCAPGDVLDCYFDRICAEALFCLAADRDCGSQRFELLEHHVQERRCRAERGELAHACLRLKQLALDGNTPSFLLRTAEFLRGAKASEPSLWFAAVLELIHYCRALGPDARSFADRVAADASSGSDAPWPFKAAVRPEAARA